MGNLGYMREETRQRVEQAIRDLRFSPSAAARSLVTKRTHTVGLLVSDVGNPFYPAVIHSVEDVAQDQGYDIFLCNTNYSTSRGLQIIRSLVAKQVDGVLIMSSGMSDAWVSELAGSGVPAVVLDWQIVELDASLRAIRVDFEVGVRQAVDHLLALGHQRFAHLSGPLGMRTSILRRDAFLHALASAGVDPAAVPVIEGNLRIDCGRQAVAALQAMPQRPTAIFAANDLMALGLVWAARDAGLSVPADFSVIGLDNIRLSGEIHPALTTVALPQSEIGRLAMTCLLDLLNNPENTCSENQSLVVPSNLIIRESTAPPPESGAA
jgi:DNA-binding LacI/PurR family transcriptional regulator